LALLLLVGLASVISRGRLPTGQRLMALALVPALLTWSL